MKTIRRSFFAAALAVVVATGSASAFNLWPHSLPRQPQVYLVRGYIDEAPAGVTVRDRITITDPEATKRRELLITSYGYGQISIDVELSRNLSTRYAVRGEPSQVASLIDAEKGTEIDAKFLVYTDGPPFLLIATLEFPAKGRAKETERSQG